METTFLSITAVISILSIPLLLVLASSAQIEGDESNECSVAINSSTSVVSDYVAGDFDQEPANSPRGAETLTYLLGCEQNATDTVVSFLRYPLMDGAFGSSQTAARLSFMPSELLVYFRRGELIALSETELFGYDDEARINALHALNKDSRIVDFRPEVEQSEPLFLLPRPISRE